MLQQGALLLHYLIALLASIVLPASLVEPLKAQITFVTQQHTHDLANGFGSVELPFALARKSAGITIA